MDENRFGMNNGGDENPQDFNNSPKNEQEEVPYEDRLKIAWYIISRSMLVNLALGLATGLAIGLLAGITGTNMNSQSANLVGTIAGISVSLLIGFPLVVGWMLKKEFNGFRIKIERNNKES